MGTVFPSFSTEKRGVPSGITPLPCVRRITEHRLVFPLLQNLHSRHSGMYSGTTESPTAQEVTPAPMDSTTPAPSWPRITGKMPSGSWPEYVYMSVWHTLVCVMRMRTSPGPCGGEGRGEYGG